MYSIVPVHLAQLSIYVPARRTGQQVRVMDMVIEPFFDSEVDSQVCETYTEEILGIVYDTLVLSSKRTKLKEVQDVRKSSD